VDDIMNLTSAGAFAPLFASPLPPPVTFVPAENEETNRRSKAAIVLGAMALAAVAIVGVAALVGARSRSSARAPTAVMATAVSAPADVSSVAATAPTPTLVMAASTAPAFGTQPAATTTQPARSAAQPARSAAHSNDTRTVTAQVPTVSTPSAVTKCCSGESEMACHMRLSAGAACGAEPPGSKSTSAPPFDRAVAARELGITMATCKRGDGPTGAGHVKVTFQPSGSVSAVDVDAPYAGTATGACIALRYRGVSVPPFAGGPLAVGKTFVIE
jgi:hypothetical protein